MTTLTHGSHTVTYASTGTPSFGTAPAPVGAARRRHGRRNRGGRRVHVHRGGPRRHQEPRPGPPRGRGRRRHLRSGRRAHALRRGQQPRPPRVRGGRPALHPADQSPLRRLRPGDQQQRPQPALCRPRPRAISNVLGTRRPTCRTRPTARTSSSWRSGSTSTTAWTSCRRARPTAPSRSTSPARVALPGKQPGRPHPRRGRRLGPDGVPQHLNKTSPYVDQNQAYGSHNLVGQFLRESDGAQGVGRGSSRGCPTRPTPTSTSCRPCASSSTTIGPPTRSSTTPRCPAARSASSAYFSAFPISETRTGSLFSPGGPFDPEAVSAFASNFMGSGNAELLLDTNPFISLLDHYVAGDSRANETCR